MAVLGKGIRLGALGGLLIGFPLATSCTDEREDDFRGSAASAGTGAGPLADAAPGTDAGGTNGSGGASGDSGDGAADSGAVSCAGEWGPPREVMAAIPGRYVESPTLSPDELEILYLQSTAVDGPMVYRSLRESREALFPAGAAVAGLEAVVERCRPFAIDGVDLSGDGLTAYIGCQGTGEYGPLFAARRSRVGSPFTVDTQDYGLVSAQSSISADELTVFSNGKSATSYVAPLFFTRSSTSAKFGPSAEIAGLETTALTALEPSPDGLWLFGTATPDVVAVRRERSDSPFSGPSLVAAGDSASLYASDPEISRDCRRLYYVIHSGGRDFTTSIRVVER